MTIIPIHVCCGQSGSEVYMMSLSLQTIPSFVLEWPPCKVGLWAGGKEV